VKNNFVELCDTKYSIKCKFETVAALTTLKDYIKNQAEDINILGLLGKQLQLTDAQFRSAVIMKNNTVQIKLRLQIRRFEVLSSYWDCKVPPKLT